MSLEHHAVLGFLQAIHHSARVAKVNSKCCRLLSRSVGKIRPVLEELDMAAADGAAEPKLASLSAALENVHMMIVRFSAMGELQAVLESGAMHCKFTEACQEVANSLQSLLKENIKCLVAMEDDINRICDQLLDFNISSSLANRQLAKDVRSTAMQILEGKCTRSEGHMRIRNMLYVICRYARDDISQEVQGLERERSRAQAEKDEQELQILTEVIKALDRKTTAADAAPCQPQPPVEYLCPISHMIMSDPVILVETGQTYDRTSIEEWFTRGNCTCPITKQVVQQFQVTPNYALKSLSTTWISVHGGEAQEPEWPGMRRSSNGSSSGGSKDTDMNACQGYPVSNCKGGTFGRVNLGAVPVMHVQSRLNSLMPNMIFDKYGVLGKGLSKFEDAKAKLAASAEVLVVEDAVAPDKGHQDDCNYEKHSHKTGKKSPLGTLAHENTPLDTLKTVLQRRAGSFDTLRSGVAGDVSSSKATAHLFKPEARISAPLPPRRASVDTNARGGQSWTSSAPRTTNLSRIPMSRQGGVQFLYDAISSSRRSLDRHRAPVSGEDSRRQSGEYASFSKSGQSTGHGVGSSAFSQHDSYSELRQDQGLHSYRIHEPAQGFMTQRRDDSYSLFSVPSHPCSFSCESDSSEEDEDFTLDDKGYQPGDSNSPVWYDSPGFDAESMASMSTIRPGGVKIAQSLAKGYTSYGGQMPVNCNMVPTGAVNLLFDDAQSDCAEFENTEISTPVLLEMIKSSDASVAAASANELAIRALKDSTIQADLQSSGVVEKLVEMLEDENSEVRLAAARTLGTLGEKSDKTRAQIVDAGASRCLLDLTRVGSVRCVDVAQWALDRLSKENSGGAQQSACSVEVSTPMLVQMMLSGDKNVQASAALDLAERLLNNANEFEALVKPDAIWRLVELLEHERIDVQSAAAIVLSFLVFRSQDVHHQVATRAGTVAKLVRLVKEADDSCAAAAAQVLRTLAHGNTGVRDEIMSRGIVPALEDLLLCTTPLAGVREVSAWLLGILGSHSDESQEEIQSGQAVYHLQHLLEIGQPHEVVAASWALQSILSAPGESDGCEVSIPIVIAALESGSDRIKMASVYELYHLTNQGFWLQMDIVECGGLQSLLKYLSGDPSTDGSHAALVTLHKIVRDVPSTPVEICRGGGVSVLVKFLKAEDKMERQLAMDVLLVLADKCPLHQPEVVTEGAVSLLTKLLLDKEESVCTAAFEILLKLADSEMSVVATSMATASTPNLLDILVRDSPSWSKESAASLIEAISRSVEGQQVLIDHGGMKVLMKVMESGESYCIKKAAGNAVAILAKKDTKAQMNLAGAGAFGTLVQLLQSGSAVRKSLEFQGSDASTLPPTFNSRMQSSFIGTDSASAHKGFQMLPSKLRVQAPLPAVPESTAEGSECCASSMAMSPKCRPCSIHESENSYGTYTESGDSALESASCATDSGESVQCLVDALRRGDGTGREAAAVRLRNLAQGDRVSRLELVKSGAVPLLVELLQSNTFKY